MADQIEHGRLRLGLISNSLAIPVIGGLRPAGYSVLENARERARLRGTKRHAGEV